MKKYLFIVLCAMFFAPNPFCYAQTDLFKLADSLVEINQPRKAAEVYGDIASKIARDKEPMRYLSAVLNMYYLQSKHRFIPDEKIVLSLDSLKKNTAAPYDVVAAMAEVELYATLSRYNYGIEYIAHCDSVSMSEWSRLNYIEKVTSLVAEVLKDSEKLSKMKGDIFLPLLTYNDVPELEYNALDVVAARVYTLLSWFHRALYQKEILTVKEQVVDTLKKYGCDETLFLFKLRDINTDKEDDFKNLIKESKGTKIQYAVKRSYAVYLYSKNSFDEVMAIYNSDKRFADDAIMMNLADIIKMKDLSFDKEGYVEPYPDRKWTCRIKSRNNKKINFTVYRIPSQISTSYGYADVMDGYEKNLKPVKSWSQKLKENQQYNSKIVDVNMPALSAGRYGVKACVGENVEPSWLFFEVSTMSCFNVGGYMTVVDKISGEPVVGAEVHFFYTNNDKVQKSYFTDLNGGFSYQDFIPQNDLHKSRDYYCTIIRGSEIKNLPFNNFYNYTYRISEAHKIEKHMNLFFDKPIYKPGDTVRYKAVYFERGALDANAYANKSVDIYIGSGEKRVTDKKITDDYGAVEGSYLIPKNFGQNSISFRSLDDSQSIRIEEYKTSQIEIVIDDELTLLSPDTLLVRGRVQTMNQYDVEGAVIVYNLEEKTGNEKTVTDINGNFSIKIGISGLEYYYKNLSLTATSPSGHHTVFEERIRYSRGMNVSVVSSHVLEIGEKKKYPDVMILDGNRKEVIHPLEIKIYEGNEPLNTENSWTREMKINEGDKLVYEKRFDNAVSVNQAVKEFPFKAGSYKIVYNLPADSTSRRLISLTFLSKTSKMAVKSKGLYLYSEENSYHQGDTIDMLLGGSVENVKVYVYKIMFDRSLLLTTCTINSSQEIVKVPFVDEDRAQAEIVAIGTKDGVNYFVTNKFDEDNAEDLLSVEMITFRDKIKVGEKEQWRLRVKDSHGNGVKAQLLVVMYNSALKKIYDTGNRPFYFGYKRNNSELYSWRMFEEDVYVSRRKNLNDRFISHQLFSLYTPFTFGYDDKLYVKRPDKLFWYRDGVSVMFSGNAITSRGNEMHDVVVTGFQSKEKKKERQIRTNFDDSGLFIAKKESDENGYAEIDFIAPQNITSWNVIVSAHSKDIKAGDTSFTISTYKHLMVSINKPRFMRDGDEIILSARIDNITDKDMECETEILINDKPLEGKKVSIKAGGHQTVSWKIAPKDLKDFFYCTITAGNGEHSDGERIVVPYLANKALITETSSIIVDKGEKKSLRINIPSKGRENHLVKLEVIKNPLWLVLENLPVLNGSLELFNCYLFNGIYANTIARHLKNEMPEEVQKMLTDKKNRIRESGGVLDMNEDVKQIAIENSPWLYYPNTDRGNYERLSRFYENDNLDYYIAHDLKTLFGNQKSNGCFSWILNYDFFDRYTSQHIAIGFGRLYAMGVLKCETFEYNKEIERLVRYLDVQFKKSIAREKLDYYDIHHLYMRSMYQRIAYENHNDELMKCWTAQPLYLQALIGMAFHNTGYEDGARTILASLKDRAVVGSNGERYWETAWDNTWYSRPFETHTAIIEFFNAMGEDVQDIKKFMILNKKANSWGYSTATVDACYAMLVGMDKELKSDGEVKVSVNGERLESESNYFTKIFSGNRITPSLNNITVESNSSTAIASIYYQYLEKTDKVKKSSNGISVERRLITGDTIKLGDKVKVRMIVTSERDMEYVQLRDNRSMALEPVEQVSCYLFSGKIGCRMVVRNCSTDFFITYLPKGTHIIDYDVIVTYKGDISAGFSEVQSLYAPEMKAVSDGRRIRVN